MNLKDFIRADKTNVDLGKWSAGHVPRSAFPMSRLKDKRYKYGPEYKWRVVKFSALGHNCRILILLNEGKQIMRARFGVDVNNDMAVLCEYEYHASEPGWHCHVTFGDLDRTGPGAARWEKTKWPRNSTRVEFGVDNATAITVIADHFRFAAQGELV